ncbi:MAG: TrkA family potassium uptake protein [Candidatus Tantalella remota]|nr:TrkA family potassium uptake protein [Candidatus Tantalella remota]
MEKDKVFAVFGLGRFGVEVCRVLASKGAKVMAVDQEQSKVDRIKDIVTQAVVLDSTDEDALRNAGMQDVDIAVVAIGDQVDGSVLTTALLKNLGVPHIIARAISANHGQVLKQIGATEVISLELEEGRRLANRILAPDLKDIIPISDNQSIAELRIPKSFIGKTLSELQLRKKFDINIVSIKRTKTDIDEMGNPTKEEEVTIPHPEDVLNGNDVLIILGSEQSIERMKEL